MADTHSTRYSSTPVWYNQTTWGAIFAGLFVAIAVQLMLSLLGIGIGFAVVQPGSEPGSLPELGVGAMLWWLVTGIISLFVGGWVAGRTARSVDKFYCALHGVILWGFSVVITVALISSMIGFLVGGALGVVQTALEAAGPAAVAYMGPQGQQDMQQRNISTDQAGSQLSASQEQRVMQEVRMLLAESEGTTLSQVRRDPELEREIHNLLTQDRPSSRDRRNVEQMLAEKANLSEDEARFIVDRWVSMKQTMPEQQTGSLRERASQMFRGAGGSGPEAEQKARDVADEAGKVTAYAGWWAFFTALLTGVAAALGGMAGRPKEDVTPMGTREPLV